MVPFANRRGSRLMIGSKALSWLSLVLTLAALCCALEAYAEDLKSASARFTDQSFALLDRLSKQGGDSPNPLLGPVASFSGDADSLRQALARSDLRSASSNISSLQADRTAIDQALKLHPNAIAVQEWNALKEQAAKLAHEIPPCGPHSDCGPPLAAARGPRLVSATSISGEADSPRIVITSREPGDGMVRLKGYFEGTALKSAGIYERSTRLRAFEVSAVPGRQKVEFDLRLGNPSAATVIRVTDADDRVAEAPAIDPSLQPPPLPAAEISADAAPLTSPDEGGSPKLPEDTGTAEIPSHGPLMPSPSKRHTLGSKLGDVRINILGVTRTRNLPPTYEIVGQITGRGITRAGIYLEGRLLQPIPIIPSANSTSFNQRIVAQSGSTTIRAYSIGGQFIEQPVDLVDAEDASVLSDAGGGTLMATSPMSATAMAVQITGVRPVAASLYVVSGVISGPDIASAGLYQNGVLAENISVGNGLAGALAALMRGSSRSFNFNARFNPYAGPATVRAFDSTGAYTEQPVVVAGISPYGASRRKYPYNGAGTFPYGGGLPMSRFPNVGSTLPLW
jgi:hypothetical protein